jgi:phosphoribosylformimino-5-aminoimidazole carboxamide ribotide isomerase
MIIYPAIDMRRGKVVRLKEGDPNRQTVFSDDPIATAQKWVEQGATWLHMINLDGAFADADDNRGILERTARLNIPIQFGGGLRQMDDIARAFDQGASRVVLGTIAIHQPEVVIQAIERWGAEAICVGLDTRDGKVVTHGWKEKAELTPIELGTQMAHVGVKHALYTDVSRDGNLQGANIEGTVALGRELSGWRCTKDA